MAIKTYKPTTKTRRFTAHLVNDDLDCKRPEKALSTGKSEKAGRGAGGRIAMRRKGGGHKKLLRLVDFKREKFGVPAVVKTIEYDPNRSANIALVFYKDGEKRYILAPNGLKRGDVVVSGPDAKPETGNALPLEKMPLGTLVHNIEMNKGRGGQIARSAGNSAVVAAKEKEYVALKLPSGEMRLIHKECYATVGVVGNEDHMNISLGKAGRSRWLGKRPKVRGVVMNPVDHPLGGGEGRTSGGRHPCSPWGQPAKGFKTRKKRKPSSAFIIKRRK